MNKYKIVLQYVGTRYSGWQIQTSRSTVQGELREALRRLTGETPTVVGAGRTDSGVHAVGQVAHFVLSKELTLDRLFRALNGILPWDIRVMSVHHARLDFHAQKQALKKRYEYRICTAPSLSPFLHGYVLHLPRDINIEAMQEAAQRLCGTHDFKGFAAATTRVKSTTRHVFRSRMSRRTTLITYQIEGSGFLHHMVRNIAGTLVEIGLGKRPSSEVTGILESRDRRLAGPTAPARGLHLIKVWY